MAIEKTLLDEILENHLEQQRIDFALSKEAGDQIQGLFDPSGIYNIPKRSQTGKMDHGALCDAVKCPYKGKENHIHTIGIGIAGAQRAMNLYGKLDIDPEEPKIVDGDGEKLWSCKVSGIDGHNQNKISLTYMQSASLTTRDGRVIKNEYMPMIVQSKAIRNVILFLVPGDIKHNWIEDYQASLAPKEKTKTDKNEKPSNTDALFQKGKAEIDALVNGNDLGIWLKKNKANIEKSPNRERLEGYIAEQAAAFKIAELKLAIATISSKTGLTYTDVEKWYTGIDHSQDKALAELLAGNDDAIVPVKGTVIDYLKSLTEETEPDAVPEDATQNEMEY